MIDAGRRILLYLGTGLILFVLPFFLLIRGAVWLHIHYALPAWISLLGGVLISGVVLLLYILYGRGRLTGQVGDVRFSLAIALALVGIYCVPALFYLSASNAKEASVRKEFTRLHPVLRLGVSTLTFLDRGMVITDADRVPEDYPRMGLPVNERSLHYRQSSGYAHAVDIRTKGRGWIRNAFVTAYFRLLGFNTLRHIGTDDHLHVSLMSHDRPDGI